jgi:D-serine deaminase-like pyridoxal phosphate-dependent protein
LSANVHRVTPFFIEIDAGYGRTGVKFDDFSAIDEIISIARESHKLKFRGFYIHAGHTYYSDILKIYDETRSALNVLISRYQSDYPDMALRIGDTPGCSMMEDFGPATELGPGNFLFYDLTQVAIGSCNREDIAIALVAPIVHISKRSGKIMVHGGGVHLSKDFIQMEDGSKCFGEVVLLTDTGWKIPANPSRLTSISQEHGVIQASSELLDSVHVGDLIGILPVHSCMTADCMKSYWSTHGEWIDHAEGVGTL